MADRIIINEVKGTNTSEAPEYWWRVNKEKPKEVSEKLFAHVDHIVKNSSTIIKNALTALTLYNNKDTIYNTYSALFSRYFDFSIDDSITNTRLTLNVIASAIDTLTNRIGKDSPTVKFVTSGGSYEQQQKAQQLTKVMLGTFNSTKFAKVAPDVFRDACIFGLGAAKVYLDEYNNIQLTKVVAPLELYVEHSQQKYGNPQDLFYRRLVSKAELADMYPDYEEEIYKCPTITTSKQYVTDQVLVIEAWHKPFSSKKPGRCIVAIENCVLKDEEYTKQYFPFLFLNYKSKIQGWGGISLLNDILPLQIALTKTYDMIDIGQELNSIPRAFVQAGSILNKNSLYDVGIVELAAGAPSPIISTAPATTPDIYNYANTLKKDALDVAGISQMSAHSTKPSGLDSGVAIRESQDIETQRFSIPAKNYQDMHIDAAKMFVDIYKDLYKQNKKLTVSSLDQKGSKFLSTIKWKDIDLKEDQFIIEAYPVSKLPQTPEGRLNFIQTLTETQLINREQFYELMDMPDLENLFQLQNSSKNLISKHMDTMIKDKIQVSPTEYMDLNLAVVTVQAEICNLLSTDINEDNEVIALLQNYLEECKLLLEEAATPQPPPPPQEALPLDPMADPMAAQQMPVQ